MRGSGLNETDGNLLVNNYKACVDFLIKTIKVFPRNIVSRKTLQSYRSLETFRYLIKQ